MGADLDGVQTAVIHLAAVMMCWLVTVHLMALLGGAGTRRWYSWT